MKNLKSSLALLGVLAAAVFCKSCSQKQKKGRLCISSLQSGTYEIYSVVGNNVLEYISERIGGFNKDIELPPGNYLVLADCSHIYVEVKANARKELRAHNIRFIPPHAPQSGDFFSVQCTRHDRSNLKQRIVNKFSFNMISSSGDLLVGMVPLKVDFLSTLPQSQVKVYDLSAVRVAKRLEEESSKPLYFVSPSADEISLTQAQEFGKWQYLLPGSYTVYVNGTEKSLSISEKEAYSIETAGLKISLNKSIDLDRYKQVIGEPFGVTLNDGNSLDVDTLYPVLPGVVSLGPRGASYKKMIELSGGSNFEIRMKSVHMDLGCSPFEWECLGRQEINLYHPGRQYAFLESVSDIPIPYFGDTVQVGVEGSKGIRYQLPQKPDHVRLLVGKLKITPKPVYKTGYMTELLRLETFGTKFSGHSFDIRVDSDTTMSLIAGSYYLTRYTSLGPDVERQTYKQLVHVAHGRETEIEIPCYLGEKRAKQLEKSLTQYQFTRSQKLKFLKNKLRPLKYL